VANAAPRSSASHSIRRNHEGKARNGGPAPPRRTARIGALTAPGCSGGGRKPVTAGSSPRSGAPAARAQHGAWRPARTPASTTLAGDTPKFRAADWAALEHRRLAVGSRRFAHVVSVIRRTSSRNSASASIACLRRRMVTIADGGATRSPDGTARCPDCVGLSGPPRVP
jgi:hypothetical protein